MTDAVCLVHGGDLSAPSGGTDRVSALAAGLQDGGYDVRLVVPAPDGPLPDRLSGVEVDPVDVRTGGVASQPLRAARLVRRARRVAAETDATLQIEHSTLAGAGSLLGCSGYVLDMHDLAFPSPLYGDLPLGGAVQRAVRHVEGRGVRDAERVVAVSERMRRLAADEWDVPADRFAVVPNGYFPEVVADHRDREPVEGRVVFLGTLHPKLDVEALRGIVRLPACEELLVVGDGARREELAQAAAALDSLRVLGRLPDEQAFARLSTAAVAVNPQHPSRLQRASSPVKLCYYAALGVPMALSAGPDLAHQLGEAGAAALVDSDGDFPATVGELLADRERRERMADRATAAAESLTWDARVEQLLDVYDALAATP